MAGKKPKTRRVVPTSKGSRRSGRMNLVHRTNALKRLFREDGGKTAFTIKTLTDELVSRHPRLFPSRPHASTITRSIEALMADDTFPLEKSTAAAATGVAGSKRQTVWCYDASKAIDESTFLLTDQNAKLEAVTAMLMAENMHNTTLAGLKIWAALIPLLETIKRDTRLKHLLPGARSRAAKYQLAVRPRRRDEDSLARKTDFMKVLTAFKTINACVQQNCRVRIHHKAEGQSKDRQHVVEPYKLIERQGRTYLVARKVTDDEEKVDPQLRLFKIARIRAADKLAARNVCPYDDKAVDDVLNRTIHALLPRQEEQSYRSIVIEARKDVANWVDEEMLNPQQRPEQVTLADGTKGLLVKIDEAYPMDIIPRILGLGPLVKVISPPELVDAVLAKYREAVTQYEAASLPGPEEGGKPPAPAMSRT